MKLFWLSAGWLVGIWVGTATPLDPIQVLLVSALCAGFWLRLRHHQHPRWLFGLLLVVSLGLARAAAAPAAAPNDISNYNQINRPVTVRGTVTDFPEDNGRSVRLLVSADSIAGGPNRTNIEGQVLVWADRWTDWRYGDRVEVVGRLEEPPEFEGFSYRSYLARQGVYSVMQAESARRIGRGKVNPLLSGLFAFRAHALDTVHRLFPEPEGSLLAGILLGVESGISDRVQAAFDATGTTHIIAISGFNISIIAGIFVHWMGRWLGVRRGAWAAGGAVAAYTLLVGADAAVVRAAIMASLALTARLLGRQQDGLAALGASAWLMTLHRPDLLWDVGFQLSFAATLGLLRFSTPWQESFERAAKERFGLNPESASEVSSALQDVVFVTLAAQLTTLPLAIYHFERLTLAAPLANFLILPLQPATMILGGIATLAGTVWLPVGQVLAWAAWPFPALTIRMVEIFSSQGWSSIALPPVEWPILVALYCLIFGAALIASSEGGRPQRIRFSLPTTLTLAIFALGTALAWEATSARPDGKLAVSLLDVGAEQAVFVRSPTGRNLLINGGASSLDLGEGLDRRISPLQRDLDWIILLGGEEETIGGLAGLIDRYPVGAALISAQPGSPAYTEIVDQIQIQGRPAVAARQGTVLHLGAGSTLTVMASGDRGSVVALEYGRFRALVAHGTKPGWTHRFRAEGIKGDFTVVILPSSGDSQATDQEDLNWLAPSVALLAVEPGNREGLPSPRTLHQLAGRTVLRTDQHGWVEITTNGREYWIEVQRTPAAP